MQVTGLPDLFPQMRPKDFKDWWALRRHRLRAILTFSHSMSAIISLNTKCRLLTSRFKCIKFEVTRHQEASFPPLLPRGPESAELDQRVKS